CVRRAVAPALVAGLGDVVDRTITQALETPDAPPPGVAVGEREGRYFVSRINNALFFLGAPLLALLGHPAVADAARALCGDDALPVYESVVVKNRGDGHLTAWHQD